MYALTLWITVMPLRDCFLPPFTSKVTRTAFYHLTGVVPRMRRMASFSVLFRDGKPLYRLYEDRWSEPLRAREGERLRARVSMLVARPPEPPTRSVTFQFGAAEMVAGVESVEIAQLKEAKLEVPRKFVVRFLTPTLLPVPGRGPLLKALGLRRRYRLLPDLPLALALLAHDFRLMGLDLVKRSPRGVYEWGLRAIAELDYEVRPVTVLYSVRDGVPVTERGFVGYLSCELLDPLSSAAEELGVLLGYAQRFGLGKSRSVGFGHVEVAPLQA